MTAHNNSIGAVRWIVAFLGFWVSCSNGGWFERRGFGEGGG
jgi:hypothetical protein